MPQWDAMTAMGKAQTESLLDLQWAAFADSSVRSSAAAAAVKHMLESG